MRFYNILKLQNGSQLPIDYICVRDKDEFMIKINSFQNQDHKNNRDFGKLVTYGVVAYLDGNMIQRKRTFTSQIHFQGFKINTGVYSKFMFSFLNDSI